MCRQCNSSCSSVVPKNTLRRLIRVVKVTSLGFSKMRSCAPFSKTVSVTGLRNVCAKLFRRGS
jgi:hypothetical protein